MSLPKFFPRIENAITPLLSAEADLEEFLSEKAVSLRIPEDISQHPFHVAGFMLLVNLCARLYPKIAVLGPAKVVEEARHLIMQINPACEILGSADRNDGCIAWGCSPRASSDIAVAPHNWDVFIDTLEAGQLLDTNMLTALAAAPIAAGELFRRIFALYLPRGRSASQPGRFNVLTRGDSNLQLPALASDIALGRVHLVGAGAVGQAAIYTLARVSVTGTLIVVDPEEISLSNLQRYVLATEGDIGSSKCSLVERTLSKTRLETISVPTSWSLDLSETRSAEVVCAAVDSEAARINLQASLPRRVYNAWTQPADIGWSRHERFGVDPCCACLYWPIGPRPSYHELVSRAIGQHELRVLTYLVNKIPIDAPLQPAQIPSLPQYGKPVEAAAWSQRSLLDDVSLGLGLAREQTEAWKGRLLADLYRDGICGGALIQKQASAIPSEMAVPLAHQSVLAGIMLAAELLFAARDELRAFRSPGIDSRLDLLAGFPQIVSRPRQRTPGCICSDQDFVKRYREKWSWTVPIRS